MRISSQSARTRSVRLSLSLILGASAALGAGPDAAPHAAVDRRLVAMGTTLSIRIVGADRPSALAASEAAVREIARVEDLLSTWRPGGPLERLNSARPGERVDVGTTAAAALRDVLGWTARTDGAFDPTVLPLVRVWGLRTGGRVPDAAQLAHALAATGRRHFEVDAAAGWAVRLDPDSGIDEGAWGKGYALDEAASAGRRAGARDALLDLGGQVYVLGRSRVAIADPRDRRRPAVSVEVENASVSTSGNSERAVAVGRRRIGHLLNPRTGAPAEDFGSATAIAPSALVADILSTAFFVLGPEKGLALSQRLRREGVPNEALFLISSRRGPTPVASPHLQFRLEPTED